jgi:cytidylate kinase
MVEQQRALGAQGGVVMEGRDIGTAVFPDADVKIFLDAAPEVRGNRRFRQAAPIEQTTARQTESRQAPAPETAEQQWAEEQAVVEEMHERDRRDRNRAESPLRPAEDAVLLDSTAMSLEEVLERAEEIVRAHLPPA